MDQINFHSVFFLLFALMAGGFAVGAVLSANIVRMACCLVASLGAVAGLFFLAGADFLGAVQLMVYVGGTMVLLVFGVMLTSQGRFTSMKTPSGHWIVATIAGGALLVLLLQAAAGLQQHTTEKAETAAATSMVSTDPSATPIGLGLLGIRVDKEHEGDGKAGYLLPFEIVSVHLLVALIAAAYLARGRRKPARTASTEDIPESPQLDKSP